MAKRAAGFLIFRRCCENIEYLLLKASYGDFHWTPPKGHVDPGEDDFTTALRETKEEAGYDESDLRINKEDTMTLQYEVRGKPKSVIYWMAELIDPNKCPTLSDEHTEFCWLSAKDAKIKAEHKNYHDLIDFFDVKIQKNK